jgi:acyl dehydratase
MMGLFYEEHVLGTCIELGTYEFTDENIRSFSTRFAPVPFHMNEEAAVAGLFGSFAAVGFHTCSAWMVCFLKTSMRARDERAAAGYALPDIGPSPGLNAIRWPRAVRAGETIAYRLTLIAMRELASKPDWGLVTALCEGHNGCRELVVSFESKMLTARNLVAVEAD